MMNTARLLCMSVLLVAAGAVQVFPQASGSTAELRGQVLDASGAVIPGAKLTLTDVAKGTSRTGTTESDGSYIFLNLLPSTYDLKVEAKNFSSSLTRIELTVGQQANIPVKLATGTLEANIDVVAGSEVVETTRTQQSTVIDDKQIVNLPISRRNYLDYALLTPGVSDSDNIADASDFRVAQTPQSGLSFGGNNGRGNLVSVDGSETMGASGGVNSTISQEAVQEFQVVRNSYSAEFGGASGGVVNIVSKSGANSYHGSAFGLFRDDALDARNAFDFNPNGQSPFNRQQYGGSVGGPLKKDRTFFFTAFERFDQQETSFVNLLTDPTLFQVTSTSPNPIIQAQAALFDYFANGTAPAAIKTGAAQLRGALTTTSYPNTVNLFTRASGQFPFNSEQTQFSARADHSFSRRSTGYVRFNFNHFNQENQAAGALTAVSRGRTLNGKNVGLLGSHNYEISSTMFNELKLGYSYNSFNVIPNDAIGPELNIEGFGNFGRDIFLPSRSKDQHYDFYDNFSKVAGTHTFKFGGSILILDVFSRSQTFFGGRFNFGTAIPLLNLLGATAATQAANPLNQYLLTTANSPYRDLNGNGIADIFEGPMTALQSFNLNLPIVYQQGFGDPGAHSKTARYALFAQDTWRVTRGFTLNYGLRYSISNEPFFVQTRYKDWQPRVGFSWDPFGSGKTVIRGGAGIFVGTVNNAVANVTTELSGMGDPDNINIVLATATSGALGLPSSFTVYQTLLARGVIGVRTIDLSDITGPPINLNPRPGAPLEVRFRLEPNYQNPATYQASLGIERDLGGGFSLDMSYLYTRGLHLTRNRDINQFKRTGPVSPLNPNGGATFIRFPTAAQTAAGLTSDFRNPLRFQDNIYESSANSFYHAFTVALQKRFSRNYGVNAHYTFAKAIDEVTDFNSDFSAQNPLNLRLDRALSSFDQRHRAVISGVLQSSFDNPFLRDWVFSPIFIAGSGRPFNLLLGADANGDGRSQSDRPGQAGRNTGVGESFFSFDMRLARRVLVKESRFLEFTFEAFNIFNRTNFTGVNNIVGTTFATATEFRVHGRSDRLTTEPLGFISASNPRQLQLGVRFNF